MDLNTGEVDEVSRLIVADPNLEAKRYNEALMEKQQEFLKRTLMKGSFGMNSNKNMVNNTSQATLNL